MLPVSGSRRGYDGVDGTPHPVGIRRVHYLRYFREILLGGRRGDLPQIPWPFKKRLGCPFNHAFSGAR